LAPDLAASPVFVVILSSYLVLCFQMLRLNFFIRSDNTRRAPIVNV
jgi:hypothetical protein